MKYKTKYSEYNCWKSMKNRCLNKNDPAYGRYGGRGITICDKWVESFFCFLDDVGPRPSLAYSIERIDNNGNYFKENCRWATDSEQQSNRRGNIYYEEKGVTKTIKAWCRDKSLNYHTVMARIKIMGWTISDAMNKKINSHSIPRVRREKYTVPNAGLKA